MSTYKTRVNPSEEAIQMGKTGIGIRFLLTREDTNGSMSVFEVRVPYAPVGWGHVQEVKLNCEIPSGDSNSCSRIIGGRLPLSSSDRCVMPSIKRPNSPIPQPQPCSINSPTESIPCSPPKKTCRWTRICRVKTDYDGEGRIVRFLTGQH
jgi:hypothetical protein